MVTVEFFRNDDNKIFGFSFSDHTESIVCAGVSALALNCVNSIEAFTDMDFTCDVNEEQGGYLVFKIPDVEQGEFNHDVDLIFNCFHLGILGIQAENSTNIKIIDKVK